MNGRFDVYKKSNGIMLAQVFGYDNALLQARQLAQKLEIPVEISDGNSWDVAYPQISLHWGPDVENENG